MMANLGMIMAGGKGTRMLGSGVSCPKALVPVAGLPLIDHNLRQLARFGIDTVFVAVPAGDGAVARYAETSLCETAYSLNVALEVFVEKSPLGNFGAVRTLASLGKPAIIVFADNLTALDLRALYDAHRDGDAAMTIATHEYEQTLPFGEVRLSGTNVVAYLEKPTRRITVCSAVSVLEPRAMAAIEPDEALGISDLVRRLIDRGISVRSFAHDALWTDVNDRALIGVAEDMVARDPAAFGLDIADHER